MANCPTPGSTVTAGRWIAAAAIGLTILFAPRLEAAVTPQEVDAAVNKCVAFLKSQQNKDGNWEIGKKPKMEVESGPSEACKWGGETAIATYALCAAGETQSDNVKRAVEWLENADLHGTYAVGLRSQVWSFIPSAAQRTDKLFDPALKRDVDFVLHSRIQHGAHKGFYGYGYGKDAGGSLGASKFGVLNPKGPAEGAWYDRSNSQYGVLGAWALEQAGAEIPQSYWKEEDEAWKKAQLTNGGWNYNTAGENSDATYTMTSAGIATLFITQDYMLREGHQFDACKGGVTNSNIERGLAWMDKHISMALTRGGGFYYYGLYGIERIGVASGRKYFGTVDWYQIGAEAIVRGQAASGSFGSVHDTCFALLFLVRGRAPVMMNKLMYETASKKLPDPWNERPRDSANLARWMGKHSVESFFNWQIVNLKVSVDELHDAPILYIAGSEELSLSDQDIEKLRTYVEQGGMILGNADCGSRIFATSFEKLGKKMFPKYEWDTIAKSHPIYSEQYLATKWKVHPIVRGLNNGVRELMLLIPESDPGRAWQIESTKTNEEAFQLAGNIFLYATGKENLEHKGATYIVHSEGEAGRDIRVARLEIGDNWDPEPGAWRRLTAVLHNQQHVGIKAEPVKIAPGSLSDYKIAALTGTTKIILSDDQRKEVKSFIANGGTLIIDAAGGSVAFADSVEAELTKMFGAAATTGLAEPLPPETPALGDVKKTVTRLYRHYMQGRVTGSLRDPRVRGITVNGRLAVFFSREDMTGALVGEPVDGVLGYEPPAATQMMASLVMYAEKSGKGLAPATPASAPPTLLAEPKTPKAVSSAK
ncbi:MAG TPA: DUF4159 domain-containing protein [Tepidisphaeraceae bacterium]|jgi:hypothetical protein|nr:DUF4159 domain-containing protein [Tepidisphaeraceae bacterium]